MTIIQSIALLITLTALFSYVNHRFIRLPTAIGVMLIALTLTLGLIGLGQLRPDLVESAGQMLKQFDFDDALMQVMLSFLLFAGALHINVNDLSEQKSVIGSLALAGVVLSMFIFGTLFWFALKWLGLELSYVWCLLIRRRSRSLVIVVPAHEGHPQLSLRDARPFEFSQPAIGFLQVKGLGIEWAAQPLLSYWYGGVCRNNAAICSELMQVAVGPADGDLQDGVQPVQAGVAGHLYPPPNVLLSAEQDDLQVVDRENCFSSGGFDEGDHAFRSGCWQNQAVATRREDGQAGRRRWRPSARTGGSVSSICSPFGMFPSGGGELAGDPRTPDQHSSTGAEPFQADAPLMPGFGEVRHSLKTVQRATFPVASFCRHSGGGGHRCRRAGWNGRGLRGASRPWHCRCRNCCGCGTAGRRLGDGRSRGESRFEKGALAKERRCAGHNGRHGRRRGCHQFGRRRFCVHDPCVGSPANPDCGRRTHVHNQLPVDQVR